MLSDSKPNEPIQQAHLAFLSFYLCIVKDQANVLFSSQSCNSIVVVVSLSPTYS